MRLYLQASEAAKEFVGQYFDKELYFDYTHLVCRTALDGTVAVVDCVMLKANFREKNQIAKTTSAM